MNALTIFSLLALALAAANAYTNDGPESSGYGSGYENPSYGGPQRNHDPGYGGPQTGYGHNRGGYGSGYGHPGGNRGNYGPSRGYGYQPVYPYPPTDRPLDALDKIYARLDSALSQIKTYSEVVDALSARQSLQKKFLDEFLQVTAVQLMETDQRQNESIAVLEERIDDLEEDESDLFTHIGALSTLNNENIDNQESAENLWAKERAVDVKQDSGLSFFYDAVTDFKDKLFQVKDNKFEVFYDSVELDTVRLASVKAAENRRMCETGRVTLDADDRRAEYLYKTWFDKVPQVLYGLCGFNFNLDAIEDQPHGSAYGYSQPPEAIGLRVNAYSTKTGLVLEAFDLGFGDSAAVTGDVCFQACTISPGVGPVIHPAAP